VKNSDVLFLMLTSFSTALWKETYQITSSLDVAGNIF